MLATFLLKNNHLAKENIIRMEGSTAERERIRLHLTFGNYQILENVNTKLDYAHEIACLLKTTIADLTEPVCPYDVYEEYLIQ
jgi:hypothetical protein